jgi:hypothetical protein
MATYIERLDAGAAPVKLNSESTEVEILIARTK